tara:strand:+ start:2070 stop:2912 length:843 start_codon:yes stop_codon:yes gene_type:complete
MKKIKLTILTFSIIIGNQLYSQEKSDSKGTSFYYNWSKLDLNSDEKSNNYNWYIGIGNLINDFNGDVRSKGIFNSDNIEYGYKISLGRKLSNTYNIVVNFLSGSLQGKIQENIEVLQTDIYDPYKLYENQGYYFLSDFIELNLMTSINIENIFSLDLDQILTRYYSKYTYKDRIDLYYEVGLGLTSFTSNTRNLISNTYIYGYGYNEEAGAFEKKESILERPKAPIFIHGVTINYLVKPRIVFNISLFGKIADTDFLDAALISSKRDAYRSLSFGLGYLF